MVNNNFFIFRKKILTAKLEPTTAFPLLLNPLTGSDLC
jgi:hypothetical protein